MSPLHVFAVLSALLISAQSFEMQDLLEESSYEGNMLEESSYEGNVLEESSVEGNVTAAIDNSIEADEFTVSSILERANKHVGQAEGEPTLEDGDIAVMSGLGNADPCTARRCKWPKAKDGKVYIPYTVSNYYSSRERRVIMSAINSFAKSTCVKFIPRRNQRKYLMIMSYRGCWSYIGRAGNDYQIVSIQRRGCTYYGTVQHELLHALGFNHEQTRSDRNRHVRIYLRNVIRGMEHNFRLINTNNLGTPYDYSSIMHYSRYAFSRNRRATIVPYPDPNVSIGRSKKMSAMDIARVNRLYQCKKFLSNSTMEE